MTCNFKSYKLRVHLHPSFAVFAILGHYQWLANKLAGTKPVHTLRYLYNSTGDRLDVKSTIFSQWGGSDTTYALNIHEDIMGSATAYTYQGGWNNGQWANKHEYDVWGFNTKAPTYNYDPMYRSTEPYYTGHPYDGSLNIYFAENRFYDAETGTWLSPDPIKDGLNWYTYCESNPTSYVDPLGLYFIIETEDEEGNTQYEFEGTNFLRAIISTLPIKKISNLDNSVGGNSFQQVGMGDVVDTVVNSEISLMLQQNAETIITNVTMCVRPEIAPAAGKFGGAVVGFVYDVVTADTSQYDVLERDKVILEVMAENNISLVEKDLDVIKIKSELLDGLVVSNYDYFTEKFHMGYGEYLKYTQYQIGQAVENNDNKVLQEVYDAYYKLYYPQIAIQYFNASQSTFVMGMKNLDWNMIPQEAKNIALLQLNKNFYNFLYNESINYKVVSEYFKTVDCMSKENMKKEGLIK